MAQGALLVGILPRLIAPCSRQRARHHQRPVANAIWDSARTHACLFKNDTPSTSVDTFVELASGECKDALDIIMPNLSLTDDDFALASGDDTNPGILYCFEFRHQSTGKCKHTQ